MSKTQCDKVQRSALARNVDDDDYESSDAQQQCQPQTAIEGFKLC